MKNCFIVLFVLFFHSLAYSNNLTVEIKTIENNDGTKETVKTTYLNNKKNGKEEVYHSSGEIKIIRYFKNDFLDGPMEIYAPNGNLLRRYNYTNNELSGPVEVYSSKGFLIQKTYFENNKQVGTEEIYDWNTGQLKTITTYNGDFLTHDYKVTENNITKIVQRKEYKKNGVYKEYSKNGELKYEKHYKDDKLDGTYKEFSDKGILELEANFKNNKLDGTISYKQLVDNELLDKATRHYKEGKLDGISIGYYEQTKSPMYIKHYKEGKLHGSSTEFHGVKDVRKSMNFFEGKLHGDYIEYDDFGKLLKKAHYENGKLHGLLEKYTNGKLEYKLNLKNGLFHGECIKYDDYGKILFKLNFINSKPIGNQESYYYENMYIKYKVILDDKMSFLKVNYLTNKNKIEKSHYRDGKTMIYRMFLNDGSIVTGYYENNNINSNFIIGFIPDLSNDIHFITDVVLYFESQPIEDLNQSYENQFWR